MREDNLLAIRHRRFVITTDSTHEFGGVSESARCLAQSEGGSPEQKREWRTSVYAEIRAQTALRDVIRAIERMFERQLSSAFPDAARSKAIGLRNILVRHY